MSSSGPDLFVVCKNCQSEVSPYITECPYCGHRLRKRAPKLDKQQQPIERPKPKRRKADRPDPAPRTARTPRRASRPEPRLGGRPMGTLLLVAVSVGALLAWTAGAFEPRTELSVTSGGFDEEPWRAVTAPFVHLGTGSMFVTLSGVMLFGWLVERRHGPVLTVLLAVAAGTAGMAVVAAAGLADAPVMGANGMALALLAAWAVPEARAARRGEELESDLAGAGVFGAALLALSLVADEVDPLAGAVGLVVGALAGLVLAALGRRRA